MKSWLANFWLDPHPRQEKIRQIWNLLLRRSATPLFSESSRALDYDGWLQSRAYLWPSANSYRDVVSRFGRLHSLYLREKISHSAATEALQEEASAINFRDHWNSTMLFDMARASRQIGLFAGSSGLYETGQAAFERELSRSDNPRKAIGLTRLAIQRGDQAKAEHFAGVLRRTKVTDSSDKTPRSVRGIVGRKSQPRIVGVIIGIRLSLQRPGAWTQDTDIWTRADNCV